MSGAVPQRHDRGIGHTGREMTAMTVTDDATVVRATSRDGTPIGYWTSGDGPPLVLVHGTTADHVTAWRALRPHLDPHVTVHAVDRRGRGASGDDAAYELEREFEDVAAVVDAVAETSGSPVNLLGHSYGGLCAFGAATRTANIGKLVLYEGWPTGNPDLHFPPPGVVERLDELLAAGDHDAVVETFLRRVVSMPVAQVEAFRAQPTWGNRMGTAPTIPRELRAFPASTFDAAQAARVDVPALLLVGAESANWRAEADTTAGAMPRARVGVLEGHAHVAHLLAPEMFAATVLAFLRA
jgi:pimeloyl-ACP methyl ester carboxylesterase